MEEEKNDGKCCLEFYAWIGSNWDEQVIIYHGKDGRRSVTMGEYWRKSRNGATVLCTILL
jgi:hypothetical protein